MSTMRPWIRLLLVIAALSYGLLPFAGMASAASAMQHGQHTGHGAHMSAQMGEGMAAAASHTDCPHHTKTDVNGHCAACLSLAALLRLDDTMAIADFVPLTAPSPALVSKVAAPLLPPPRA